MKNKTKKILDSEKSNVSKKIDSLKLYQIEMAVEKKVISDIRKRQKNVPGLKQDKLKYTAIWGRWRYDARVQGLLFKGQMGTNKDYYKV